MPTSRPRKLTRSDMICCRIRFMGNKQFKNYILLRKKISICWITLINLACLLRLWHQQKAPNSFTTIFWLHFTSLAGWTHLMDPRTMKWARTIFFSWWMDTFKGSKHSKVGPYIFVSCWMDTFEGYNNSEGGPYLFFTCSMYTFEGCIKQTPLHQGIRGYEAVRIICRGRGAFLPSSPSYGIHCRFFLPFLKETKLIWVFSLWL